MGKNETVRHKAITALRDADKSHCLQALRTLEQKDAAATGEALLEALAGTDKQLRARSAWVLALLGLKEMPKVTDALTLHLQHDINAEIRLCCAVGLVSQIEIRPHDAPEDENRAATQIRDAYIHAISDENEKVALIALGQLGFHGGAKAVAALFKALAHPAWRLRLEACKSLITLRAADLRVVAALEQLAQEAEAQTYDAEIAEFRASLREIREEIPGDPDIEGMYTGMWGTLAEILEQARTIATQQR